MGRLPINNRNYEIQILQEDHREILRRLTVGQSVKDIAKALSITPTKVTYVKNSRLGKNELSIIQGARNAEAIEISKQIKELQPKAIALMEEVMDDEEKSPRALRVKIAMDILDRGGHGAIKRNVNLNKNLSEENINKIKDRARLMGEESGVIVDAEYVEET